jgi:hypothetical protein
MRHRVADTRYSRSHSHPGFPGGRINGGDAKGAEAQRITPARRLLTRETDRCQYQGNKDDEAKLFHEQGFLRADYRMDGIGYHACRQRATGSTAGPMNDLSADGSRRFDAAP